MADPESTDATDASAVFYLFLTFVGALITAISLLGVFPLRVDLLIVFAGSYVFAYGLIPFFGYLPPIRSTLRAYLTGGDPERIPRWVYAGLFTGIPAEAGGFILFYYAISTADLGAAALEMNAGAALFGIGIEPLRYSVAFLRGYWVEA